MSSLADQYRAERAAVSGSSIYRQQAAPAARPTIYAENTYQGLSGYQGGRADKLARLPGESTESWRRKVLAVGRHLPEDELAARLAEIDKAEQPQSHEQFRAEAQARQTGSSRGIFGAMTATDMGRMVNGAMVRTNSMSESPIPQNGHLHTDPISAARPLSAVEAATIARQRDAQMRGQQPQHQVAPTGSSGEGWTVTR
jgi:hypothetical protein